MLMFLCALLIPNRIILVRFGGTSGELVEPWFVFCKTQSSKNTHGETKQAWYAPEAYQKGTIRYLPCPNSAQNHDIMWYQVSDLMS